MTCRCGTINRNEFDECTVHVVCDELCFALINPTTLGDYKVALEHSRDHGYLGGCSHGS